LPCHSERSEESAFVAAEILRCAQNDMDHRYVPVVIVKIHQGSARKRHR